MRLDSPAMFFIPEIDWRWTQVVTLIFLVLGPLTFLNETRGAKQMGYSKFARPDARKSVPSRVGMFIVYFPAALAPAAALAFSGVTATGWHWLAMGLVTAHFAKRCAEVLFLHRYSGRMDLDAVVPICLQYTLQSVTLAWIACVENPLGPPGETFPVALRVGMVLWGLGTSLNLYHHWLLSRLRKDGAGGYHLPRGGLFGWVACPHYFGELVAWFGFALVFHHITALVFFSTMLLYLMGRSSATLSWYREKLTTTPEGWRRLIPLVY